MILNTTKAERTKPLPGLRKAAMLLIVLGEQASADLLQQLSEDDVQKVSREVAKSRPFPPNRPRACSKNSTTSPRRAITWRAAAWTSPASC